MNLWPDTARVEDGRLKIAGMDVEALCERYGTPLYILDETTFRAGCRAYRNALRQHYPGTSRVFYSGKSLLNMMVARWASDEGLGIDVVSAGEFELARRAGVPTSRLHFHGNAKPRDEILSAVAADVGAIIVDNLDELATIEFVGAELGRSIRVLLRIAPDVQARTHTHIQTGLSSSKFGLRLDDLPSALNFLKSAKRVSLNGIHCHLGSQIFDLNAYSEAIEVLLDTRSAIETALGYLPLEFSPGGGLAATYVDDDPEISIDNFVKTVANCVVTGCARRSMELPDLFLEPGRSISARTTVAVYRVIARKELGSGDGASCYVHVDGGIADNPRPALYGAKYHAALVTRMDAAPTEHVHIAGRYCEFLRHPHPRDRHTRTPSGRSNRDTGQRRLHPGHVEQLQLCIPSSARRRG